MKLKLNIILLGLICFGLLALNNRSDLVSLSGDSVLKFGRNADVALEITIPQVQALNRRVNAILNDTGTVKLLLETFDSDQEG
jgi:hypothetical protein